MTKTWTGADPELDTILEVCTDEHRRIILEALGAHRRTLTVRDLVHAIVDRDHHAPVDELRTEEFERIHLALHHIHLPELERAGLVEYDSKRNRVEPTATFDEVYPVISSLLEADPVLEP